MFCYRKTIAYTLSFVVLVSLTACGNFDKNSGTAPTKEISEECRQATMYFEAVKKNDMCEKNDVCELSYTYQMAKYLQEEACGTGSQNKSNSQGEAGNTQVSQDSENCSQVNDYSQTQTILAGDPLEDSRDGRVYKTVKIGSQVWMAENLNYDDMGGSYTHLCYDNNLGKCAEWGMLYTWDAAKAACPMGWRLPQKDDWNELVKSAGGKAKAGRSLKSTSGWNNNCSNGDDIYGFSALPAGSYTEASWVAFDKALAKYYGVVYVADHTRNYFEYGGSQAFFWGASEKENGANVVEMWGYQDSVQLENYSNKKNYYSVRCVKDVPLQQSSSSVDLESSSSVAEDKTESSSSSVRSSEPWSKYSSSSESLQTEPVVEKIFCHYVEDSKEYCDERDVTESTDYQKRCSYGGVMVDRCKDGYREKCGSKKTTTYIYSGTMTCNDMYFL